MSGVKIDFAFDYAYISNPPIFADIGEATLSIDGLSFSLDWSNTFNEESGLNLTISNLALDFENPVPLSNFDGLSDFSEIATNVVNTVAAVVRNRLSSMLN